MNFTVIVPTCRRPDTLARCLRTLPSSVRIIVTDDGRDEETRKMIAATFPQIDWIAGPCRGPAANRNHGARAATSEWLAFVDDDCEPQPGWIEALSAVAAEADIVEGRTMTPGAVDSPFQEHIENYSGGVFWSCNLAVRKEVFTRLGGFDEDFTEAAGEDMEFAWRVAHAGLRVRFAPAALVHHPPRRIGLTGVWKRIWMIRWMSLYRLKTGDSPSLDASFPQVAWSLFTRETVMVMRLALHCITRPSKRPRMQLFHAAIRLSTLPVVLPYMLACELGFRQLLERRSLAPTRSP